jgi:hypothetical protein
LVVITSIVILVNSYHESLGNDDSDLDRHRYRATWYLMIFSAAFFTLGSFAFVRAVHISPPITPLFTWYHISTDELLGSWLFLFACIPFIPYSLIFLADEQDKLLYAGTTLNVVNYNSIEIRISLIAGALIVSILLVAGAALFVRASYPSLDDKVGLLSRNHSYFLYYVNVAPRSSAIDTSVTSLL